MELQSPQVDEEEEMEGQFNLQALVKKVEALGSCLYSRLAFRAWQEQEARREAAEETGKTPEHVNKHRFLSQMFVAGRGFL